MKPYENRLKAFFGEKERLARSLALQEQKATAWAAWPSVVPRSGPPGIKVLSTFKDGLDQALVPGEQSKLRDAVWYFFAAGKEGNWRECRRLYRYLARHSHHFAEADRLFESTVWQPINESFRAYEQLADGEPGFTVPFARDILECIPPGSIYFGDTDSGLFLVEFLNSSSAERKPFFVLTQNQLADWLYDECVEQTYGDAISLPSQVDYVACRNEYEAAANDRLKRGVLKPDENVKMVNGELEISGPVAVMELSGHISKLIFERNPDREFYVQENYAEDWMRSFLTPHGPLLKLYRQPVGEITEEMVRKDSDYWTPRINRLIGDWLKPETPLDEVVDFVERVYLRRDLKGFKGDPNFVRTERIWKSMPDYVSPAHWISGMRMSVARLYAWRIQNVRTPAEQERLLAPADFAFRQAFAVCPHQTDVMIAYGNFLWSQRRLRDAALIARTVARFYPDEKYYRDLVGRLSARTEVEKWIR